MILKMMILILIIMKMMILILIIMKMMMLMMIMMMIMLIIILMMISSTRSRSVSPGQKTRSMSLASTASSRAKMRDAIR